MFAGGGVGEDECYGGGAGLRVGAFWADDAQTARAVGEEGGMKWWSRVDSCDAI